MLFGVAAAAQEKALPQHEHGQERSDTTIALQSSSDICTVMLDARGILKHR